MFDTKLFITLCATATISLAQTPPTYPGPQPAPVPAPKPAVQNAAEGGTPTYIRPETPEQRKARLGTAEDPGTNPDPNKHYWRFGKSYHIERFERRFAAYDREEGWVRPLAMVNFDKEIYQQNEKYVWIWQPDPLPEDQKEAAAPPPTSRYNAATLEFFGKIRPDFTPLTPPAKDVTVRFEESSEGLPTSGSWRSSLAVADMNGDGCVDLIAPPERGGGNDVPSIFLGDCKGKWTYWKDVKWPHTLQYGAVVAADFNKDGHMDLAFAVHLLGVYVFLGDGKGNFTAVSEGLPRDFATRRLVATDLDGDGYPDLVAVSEGPTAVQGVSSPGGNLRVLLNRKKGTSWEAVPVADPASRFGGDWLSVADFNGDRRPDIFAASVYFNGYDILYLSRGPKKWSLFPSDGVILPSLSYYHASTAGEFTSKKHDDVVISYVHLFPNDVDPNLVPRPVLDAVVNVDLLTFNGNQPKRVPIMRWGSSSGVWGLGSGDFDGDGKLDVIFTRFDPRDVVLLLGDGNGDFARAKVEGFTLLPRTNYDLKVADVNGDGKPDLIIMYESSSTTSLAERNGSIHVYLNRGVVVPSAKTP